MVSWERKNKRVIDEAISRQALDKTLQTPTMVAQMDPKDGSIARQVLLVYMRKAVAAQADPAWKETDGY